MLRVCGHCFSSLGHIIYYLSFHKFTCSWLDQFFRSIFANFFLHNRSVNAFCFIIFRNNPHRYFAIIRTDYNLVFIVFVVLTWVDISSSLYGLLMSRLMEWGPLSTSLWIYRSEWVDHFRSKNTQDFGKSFWMRHWACVKLVKICFFCCCRQLVGDGCWFRNCPFSTDQFFLFYLFKPIFFTNLFSNFSNASDLGT